MAKASVLVTTAGTIVAQGIIKCLKLANSQGASPGYRIVTTDASPDAAGLYRSDVGYLVPPFSSENYVQSICKICREEGVKAIFVGADEELLIMAREAERIKKETGALVITSPNDVIAKCIDKWKTFEFLAKSKFPCPDSALPEDEDAFFRDRGYPSIVKPREGHGSLLVYVVRNREEARSAYEAISRAGWKPMIQKYLSGEEFTTGVTTDRHGKYIMSSIAMRRTLKGGQTYKAFVDDYPEIRKACEEVAIKLGSKGPVNVQGRLSGGKLKIFEINPRFSASCPIRAAAGVNEPDIVFRNLVLGEYIRVEGYEKLVCMRYWNEVYVPFPAFDAMKEKGKLEKPDSRLKDYF